MAVAEQQVDIRSRRRSLAEDGGDGDRVVVFVGLGDGIGRVDRHDQAFSVDESIDLQHQLT